MAHRHWDDSWQRFPKSVPIAVADGIVTSKKRGAMSGTWWSQRFVEVLESYGLGTRMARGRSYARSGQVASLDVSAGQLVSQVQGSRRTPYLVKIVAPAPSAAQWLEIETTMSTSVGFVARLLSGEIPAELEAVFVEAKASLLPTLWEQLQCTCSCPDWENPCKHIAAVLYVFADQLDDDPWLLIQWRGRTRDEILAPLRDRGLTVPDGPRVKSLVAPWWPLGDQATIRTGAIGGAKGSQIDTEPADSPDPCDAVLRRCETLEIKISGSAIPELLMPAYEAMLAPAPGLDTGA